SIEFLVEPGDLRIAAGRPLTIVAKLNARASVLTHLAPTLSLESNGQVRAVPMDRGQDGRYQVRINAVDRSFGYRVHAGSAASRRYAFTALVPPRANRI